ncbi:MAG: hypothetical protein Q9164_000430 [Protoblastenia rupestris]
MPLKELLEDLPLRVEPFPTILPFPLRPLLIEEQPPPKLWDQDRSKEIFPKVALSAEQRNVMDELDESKRGAYVELYDPSFRAGFYRPEGSATANLPYWKSTRDYDEDEFPEDCEPSKYWNHIHVMFDREDYY